MTEDPPRETTDESPGSGPPTNRMVVAVLSLVGIFLASYLLLHNLGYLGTLQCAVGSCEVVQASRYARVGPVPVAGIGVLGYLALFVLALAGLQPRFTGSRWIGGLLLGGALIGVGFSAYLTYIEAAVLEAWCQWCVVSAILITVIFGATLPEGPRLVRGG